MVANESDTPEARFLRFALRVYDDPAAQAALLRLQDRSGADIPLLLWAMWRGVEGDSIPSDARAEALRIAALWRTEIVAPLRTLRRRLKPGVAGLPDAPVQAARRAIAAAEIETEKRQMAQLAALRPAPSGPASAQAIRGNLAAMAPPGRALDPAELERILAAALA